MDKGRTTSNLSLGQFQAAKGGIRRDGGQLFDRRRRGRGGGEEEERAKERDFEIVKTRMSKDVGALRHLKIGKLLKVVLSCVKLR